MAKVASEKFQNAADLLAYVLCRGVSRLLKKGLDRGYIEHEDIVRSIRGRIDLGYTGRHGLHRQGFARCRFDELEHDILSNQILKSTIKRFLCVKNLDNLLRDKLRGIYCRLSDVREIELNPSIFSRIPISRNNHYYQFLLHICQLVVTSTIPDQQHGTYHFLDFLRDEKRMAYLFQKFVFKFLQKEQTNYTVKVDHLSWLAETYEPGREGDIAYLPKMETDISLRSSQRTLIIDTKYYADVLRSKNEGKNKVNASNLYQIHAYLSCLESREYPDNRAEGLLLYPTNGYVVDLAWKIQGHNVRVKTLDLGCDWRCIHKNLLALVGIEAQVGTMMNS